MMQLLSRKMPTSLLMFTVASAVTFAQAWLSHGPVAMTEHGQVEGVDNHGILKEAKVDSFFGIPYAAPPVGANRLRPPQPFTESWAPKVRLAQKEARACAQIEIMSGKFAGDEDCLYLNVFRPTGATNGSNIPVIIWIYGGGFAMGDSLHIAAGIGRMYDPTNIIEKHGHVFVSMNYRLNGFGFMALPELAAENPTGTTGNYGLQDQRAAMQWVQRNIRNFGGDPSKVTIQGESAGGMSVMFHLVSPASQGLFHGAIEESGSFQEGCYFQNRTDAYLFNRQWAAIKGCNSSGPELLACLRKLDTSAFMVGFGQMVKDWVARLRRKPLPADIPQHGCEMFPANAWGAVIDGAPDGLPNFPEKLLAAGTFNNVPLLVGNNLNEGAMFGWLFPLLYGKLPYPIPGAEQMKQIADWFLRKPADRSKFLELYAGDDWPAKTQLIDRVDRFWRDSWTDCPARETAKYVSEHGGTVYRYVFSFPMHTNILPVIHAITSTHGFELPFVFRNWIGTLGHLFLHPGQYNAMTDVMSCSWASFVKCQKPKCSDPVPGCPSINAPEWPAWQSSARKYISFKVNTTIEDEKAPSAPFPEDEFPGDDRCDFWKNVDNGWQDLRRPWPFELPGEMDVLPDEALEEMLIKHIQSGAALWGTAGDHVNETVLI
jgi:para-nitrobenzyl esterase